MKLSAILRSFTKVQAKLNKFVQETEAKNKELRKELRTNEVDVESAKNALTQLKRITGK